MLTDEEIDKVSEITGESYDTVETAAADISAATEAAIVADITLWDGIRDKHLKIKGGSDGVDLDNQRKRDAITERVRLRLGFASLKTMYSGSASVPTVSTW